MPATKPEPTTEKMHNMATRHEPIDGTFKLVSRNPAVDTFTFCWNSSTIESMSSSDVSESELAALTMHSVSEAVASLKIDDSALSGS